MNNSKNRRINSQKYRNYQLIQKQNDGAIRYYLIVIEKEGRLKEKIT